MTSLVKAIQERLAKICHAVARDPLMPVGDEVVYNLAVYVCAAAIRAADLSDLEPKEVDGIDEILNFPAAVGRPPTTNKPRKSLADMDRPLAEMVGDDLLMACGILIDGRSRWRSRAEATESELAALTARLEAKEAECEALRRDAERYRFLRSEEVATNPKYYPFWNEFNVKLCRENKMDAAVDAALKELK